MFAGWTQPAPGNEERFAAAVHQPQTESPPRGATDLLGTRSHWGGWGRDQERLFGLKGRVRAAANIWQGAQVANLSRDIVGYRRKAPSLGKVMACYSVDIIGKAPQHLGTVVAENQLQALQKAIEQFAVRPALRSKVTVTKVGEKN